MACSLAEHKRRSYAKIAEIVKDTDSITWQGPNIAVFGFGTKDVPEKKNAIRHAKRKQKLIEEWAEKEYPGFGKDWALISTGGNDVVMDIRMPYRLSKAIQKNLERIEAEEIQYAERDYQLNRQRSIEEQIEEQERISREYANEWVYNGQIYASREDMIAAMQEEDTLDEDFMLGNDTPLNIPYYIGRKNAMLDKLEARLNSISSQRNAHKKDIQMSELLTRQHAEVLAIKNKLKAQIKRLEDEGVSYLTRVENSLKEDFQFIDGLLNMKGVDNTEDMLANLDMATDMMRFFLDITNSDDIADNNISKFFHEDADNIHPVKHLLDFISSNISTRAVTLSENRKEILKEIVSNDSSIRRVFDADMTVDEIVKEMLSSKDDIDWFSKGFLSVDKSLNEDDGLFTQMFIRHLREKISDKKASVIRFKDTLDRLHDDVIKELKNLNQGITNRFFKRFTPGASFDIFFQKGPFGRTGRIIDVFSAKWSEKLKELSPIHENYGEAIASSDYKKIETAVEAKQRWLFSHTNMIDIARLPDIISNPRFSHWKHKFNSADADAYAEELKSKIGEHNYKRLVNKQTQLLDDYIHAMDRKLGSLLSEYSVSEFSELPAHAQRRMVLYELSHDPFALIDSLRGTPDQYGKINYDVGDNSSVQLTSHVLYNAYYPKEQLSVLDKMGNPSVQNSGYYDADYAVIDKNPTLKEYWSTLRDVNDFMIQILSQSGTYLSEGSLVFHEKNFAEILLSKDSRFFRDGKNFIFNSTRNTLREAIAEKVNDNDRPVEDVNRGNIHTVEEKVREQQARWVLLLENALNKNVTAHTAITLDKASPEVQALFKTLFKETDINEIIAKTGPTFKAKTVIKSVLTEKVMEEQTMNLPLLMKAYLDIIAEYGGRKDAMLFSQYLRDMHMGLKKANPNPADNDNDAAKDDINSARRDGRGGKDRTNSNLRMKDAYNKLLLNRSQKQVVGRMGKMYDSEEKKHIKEINKQIKLLEEQKARLDQEENREERQDVVIAINQKIDKIDRKIESLKRMKEHMGHTIAASAIFETLFAKLRRFSALGYSILAPMKNYMEGMRNAMIFDTGNFATPGNISVANTFLYKSLFGTKLSKSMATAKNITDLFIQNMDLIQNGVNEFEKNSRKTGAQAKSKWFKAYKGTEIAERGVQIPEILALFMDMRVPYYDEFGELRQVPLFNGSEFPAHDIVDGKLVLKNKFKVNPDGSLNQANIDKWENFRGPEYNDIKSKLSSTIKTINGAYDEFASMMVKNNALGTGFMTFKTWVPEYIWARYSKNQRVLDLGKQSYTGYYRNTLFDNNKTHVTAGLNVAGSMAATAVNRGYLGWAASVGLGVGLVVSANFLVGAAIFGTAIYGGVKISKYNKKIKQEALQGIEHIAISSQIAGFMKATMIKFFGLPLNVIHATVSNKKNAEEVKEAWIKDYSYDKMDITEEEKISLNAMNTEMILNLYAAFAKIGVAYLASAFLIDDEEEEEPYKLDLVTLKKTANPAYTKQEENDPILETTFFFVSNILDELLSSGSATVDPIGSVETLGRRNAIFSTLDNVGNVATGVQQLLKGKDEILSGPNQGESRLMNDLLKLSGAPKVLTDKYLGVENTLVKDFTPDNGPERWFDTDFKKDIEANERHRKLMKNMLKKKAEERMDFSGMGKFEKEMLWKAIMKQIDEEIDMELPIPYRDNYDDEQNLKDD